MQILSIHEGNQKTKLISRLKPSSSSHKQDYEFHRLLEKRWGNSFENRINQNLPTTNLIKRQLVLMEKIF